MALGHSSFEHQREQEVPDFYSLGGSIIENDQEGRPARWLCGMDSHGHQIDPPDAQDKPVTHYLNHDGAWEGHLTSPQDMAEAEAWKVE